MNEGETLQNEGLLRELLVTALDGDATDAELRQLNDALRSDESLRRSTHRFLCDDALLAEEIGTLDEALHILKNSAEQRVDREIREQEPELTKHQATVSPASRKQSTTAESASFTIRGWRSFFPLVNRHGLAVAALALFALAAVGWHHLRLLSEFERLHSLAAAPNSAEQKQVRIKSQRAAIMPGPASVARATAVVDCEWLDRGAELKFGDELSPGQRIRLKQGLLQLTFATGAKVVVEGPADFVATTATEAVLTEGKIAAAVPRFARGYTILTPTAEIVDLGTEFGVNVDGQGNSEVHVFDGDVVARPREKGVAQGELLHARQDEAIQFAASKGGQRISVDSSKFVRRLTPGRPTAELPPLPVTHDLALWLAADVMPIREPETPVATWPDVLVGDNQFPDDAWQFNERICPKWVRDANGLPAVRFDGWSTFLATSPMATSDRQTAFVVFAPGPTSFAMESHGAMLLKYGLDTPSLELALLPDFSPRAWIWASNDDGSTSNVGVLRGPQVKPHVPCAVAYTYDALTDRSEMLLNGKEVAVGTAPKPLEQQARKYIGAHAQPWMETYFLGNMYEILVYDTALDKADCGRVFEYLSKRYGFSLAEL